MKQKLSVVKRKYTIMPKKYVAIFCLVLGVAIGSNLHFINAMRHEEVAVQSEGEDVTIWTRSFLGILANKWDPQELLSRAHPVLIGNINAAGHDINQDFKPLSELGKIEKENCTLVNFAASKSVGDRFTTATVTCNPEYERGTANVIVELKQDHINSPWRIVTFTFNIGTIVKPGNV